MTLPQAICSDQKPIYISRRTKTCQFYFKVNSNLYILSNHWKHSAISLNFSSRKLQQPLYCSSYFHAYSSPIQSLDDRSLWYPNTARDRDCLSQTLYYIVAWTSIMIMSGTDSDNGTDFFLVMALLSYSLHTVQLKCTI